MLDLPNAQLAALAARADVESIHDDRPVFAHLNRVAVTVGARDVQANMGYDGAGVGVAVIDSGVTAGTTTSRDLTASAGVRVRDGQRVAAFVDFVNGQPTPYDDNGHGTHVAGHHRRQRLRLERRARRASRRRAHLVSLKVLDAERAAARSATSSRRSTGSSRTARAYNIRVVNLSVGAAVTESY